MNIDIQDPNKLVSDGNEMSEQARQFKEEVKRIYEITDDLKNSWVGESSKRFTDNIEKYRADFEAFGDAIGKFGSLISSVGQDYINLENEL